MTNSKGFNRWAKKLDVEEEKQETEDEATSIVKSVDLTSFVKCLDYQNVHKTDAGDITFEIRLFDKEGVLKIHPITARRKEARRFARRIMRITKIEEEE
jgi:hypothetical protein